MSILGGGSEEVKKILNRIERKALHIKNAEPSFFQVTNQRKMTVSAFTIGIVTVSPRTVS